MKHDHARHHSLVRHLLIPVSAVLLLVFTTSKDGALGAENEKTDVYKINFGDMLASARAKDLKTFEGIAEQFGVERKQLSRELLNIFRDTKASNLNRCSAAYYLGEMRIPEAAEDLAAEITLDLDISCIIIKGLPSIPGLPAVDALIKIGIPAIPAVIRNLEESDDPKVRELSLRVISRIEDDKEIAQLRLRRAIDVQQDLKKKSRVQAALQKFHQFKFDK